ncbi:tRNA (cytosine(32)/uridine(32)-2'-O)-methyltransferase TrmJ [Sedimenticola selenatireducens]|uniref:tRNA (cytidine/uridine-2'-O-)-methyltransferase TrmJ n=1 Tax=Sedimenticola selenatireducens TaxID=191960 RepID=A0A558DZH5_9GAMM|nr:tRNA (cytosine(32)/uridine(32)-2'-O)-methyltransferase TrmJ [Sedimenticola selenatireducens]TVO68590.1 tRNA (cytosine(32)/uridine(32)-2'-O)-methyltransferase TrmJ [Sedimenticola selenatireducens]TVT66494.1 MAG: tRNA (cytosine(32)/uridine(32)-2'-O)-methyltransferase TrmJ [Sedimenticola selenatireducens]
MLKNIKIVLIETTHPGNIGAAARAMKNMALENLCLVSPKVYPSAEATARAAGADSILESCQVYDTLDEALQGCRLVVGASARLRTVDWPQVRPRECAEKVWSEAAQGEVAILFGRESSGLRNSELDRCQYLVHIPANPEYSSLNIAQALQVIAYEVHLQSLTQESVASAAASEVASAGAMEGFFQHLQQTMEETGFSHPQQSEKLQRRLRRLFFRARPDPEELNILRGILSAAQGRKSMRRE